MRIRCRREELEKALGVVAAVVPGQSPSPVALSLLMEAGEDGLRLQSTDLSIFTEVRVLELAEVEPGDALIPAARIVGLVREVATEDVIVEREPGQLSVRLSAGGDDFRIMGQDPGDFPQPPAASEIPAALLESERLAEAFNSVAFAASRDAARQQLQGVAVIFEGRKVLFVATDGKRLAEYSMGSSEEVDRRREGIVPMRAVDAIERLLSLDSGQVAARLDPAAQQIVVSHDHGRVLSRLLQGQMPDYVSMIPTEFEGTVEGSARDMLAAVRKAAVLTTKEHAVISLELHGGALAVRVSSQDVGSGVVPVGNVTVSGADLSLNFAVSFLADGFRVLGDRPVRLGLQGGKKAAVMHSGRTFRYAFMPVMPHGAAE